MKIYCPLNLAIPSVSTHSVRVYGWIDSISNDVFICSFKKLNNFQDFQTIFMDPVIELGYLQTVRSELSAETEAKVVTFALPNRKVYISIFSTPNTTINSIIIYYQIYRDFSNSADFSGQFSTSPLKYIKWSSIINFNKDGKFLQLSPFQRLLRRNFHCLLSHPLICDFNDFAHTHSLRKYSPHSGVLDQFFKRKDNLEEMHRYLLLNDSISSSDTCRHMYRNNLILALTDLLLGSLTGLFLSIHSDQILDLSHTLLSHCTITFFEETLDWFMGWPAGFKFNANLTKFLGKFFISLLALWRVIFFLLIRINFSTLSAFNHLKHFGLSMLFGTIIDYCTLSTLHIYTFYRLITVAYRWYFLTMISLFRLFRGKKWNVLRNRVDQADFTMDQLLVGTLLFSILFCTFPTIIAYYLLFLSAYLACLILRSLLLSILIILNYFPIYPLILKFLFKSPNLTERFKLVPHRLMAQSSPSFRLLLIPLSTASIFTNLFSNLSACWCTFLHLDNLYNIISGHSIKLKLK